MKLSENGPFPTLETGSECSGRNPLSGHSLQHRNLECHEREKCGTFPTFALWQAMTGLSTRADPRPCTRVCDSGPSPRRSRTGTRGTKPVLLNPTQVTAFTMLQIQRSTSLVWAFFIGSRIADKALLLKSLDWETNFLHFQFDARSGDYDKQHCRSSRAYLLIAEIYANYGICTNFKCLAF